MKQYLGCYGGLYGIHPTPAKMRLVVYEPISCLKPFIHRKPRFKVSSFYLQNSRGGGPYKFRGATLEIQNSKVLKRDAKINQGT